MCKNHFFITNYLKLIKIHKLVFSSKHEFDKLLITIVCKLIKRYAIFHEDKIYDTIMLHGSDLRGCRPRVRERTAPSIPALRLVQHIDSGLQNPMAHGELPIYDFG